MLNDLVGIAFMTIGYTVVLSVMVSGITMSVVCTLRAMGVRI